MSRTKKRRSGIQIMGQLIGLVKSMLHIMLAAILLGTVGYLCAIFLTITADCPACGGLRCGYFPGRPGGLLLLQPIWTYALWAAAAKKLREYH